MNLSRYLPRALPAPLEGLVELALDLRWTRDRSIDPLWRAVDAQLWEATGNPWAVLEGAPQRRLESLAQDPDFIQALSAQLSARRTHLEQATWFDEAHSDGHINAIGYFSMEFGLTEALPIYSGGLGMLAGDHLKSASDLGVPVVGMGLLYQQGYFHQALDANGRQIEFFPYNNPSALPIRPSLDTNGDWLRVSIDFPDRTLYLRAWQVQVGRVTLHLLDSNYLLNSPMDRGITSELYGGGPELRLQQEMVLGIGGYRLLQALNVNCEVCHLNEGHAAFAVLERALTMVKRDGVSFATALRATRVGNIFTTHTPVAAGFDRFSSTLMAQYLGEYAKELGLGMEELLSLGRADPTDASEPFNMAYLAVRGTGRVNGVSRLHGAVSKRIFQPLFPHWPEQEVPVGYVTNGVHIPSWESAVAEDVWSSVGGPERWSGTLQGLDAKVRTLSAAELWAFRSRGRESLIRRLRERMAHQHARRGADPRQAAECLNPNTLTLGFARRFATYKRPTLLLHDADRLTRLLTHPQWPVQLVIAGKAHPRDEEGKRMVQEWNDYIRRTQLSSRVLFLEDYDMALAADLVQGVDLWINTPRRPWEASGTSGMKVLVNGGLNVSELDGWWAEAYASEVGWAIGDGQEHDADAVWDICEAEQLYALLEREIVPIFYERDRDGIPLAWVERIRESMARLTPQYSSNRMMREYAENCYIPATADYRQRCADGGAVARLLELWAAELAHHWGSLRFGTISVRNSESQHLFEVPVYLDDLSPESVRVELYAEGQGPGSPPELTVMQRHTPLTGAVKGYLYTAAVSAKRPSDHYTPRIIPFQPNAKVPLDVVHILWQR